MSGHLDPASRDGTRQRNAEGASPFRDRRPSAAGPSNVYPGEGREPVVAGAGRVSGQEDIRPSFEKPPHRPDRLPRGSLNLGKVVGK